MQKMARSCRIAVMRGSTLVAASLVVCPPVCSAADDTEGEASGGNAYRTQVRTRRGPPKPDEPGEAGEDRAAATVTKRALQERQVRSTPEALRWTPGVAVQQTAHGQASAYIRGFTGRRTLLLMDGLRLNHALFRQGPNQYLYTVDPESLAGLSVVRGSAGVELGANAIGGAILAQPAEPTFHGDLVAGERRGRTQALYRHATADSEHAGRVQADVQLGPRWAALFGVGGRTAGKLQSAGHVGHLVAPESLGGVADEKEVPRLEDDGRTQRGTGFDIFTADARIVAVPSDDTRITVAGYAFRQFDSPRTDLCPPPEGRDDECLLYEEQFRTHVYSKAELAPGTAFVDRMTAAVSWQRQHERRRNSRNSAVTGGRDDIDVFEVRTRLHHKEVSLAEGLTLRLPYGLDASAERVASTKWTTLSDSGITRLDPRGQYLDGSRYHQGGAWLAPRLDLGDDWTLRAGARWAFAMARAPGDEESDTAAVDRGWSAAVASAGVRWAATEGVTFRLNVDQGFRPPNLDDLTARQLTGQGRQLENPDLTPERATSVELGVALTGRGWFAQGWAFQTWLTDGMERRSTDCPDNDRECDGTRRAKPFRLTNLPGTAILRGLEADAGCRPARGVEARGFAAWAWGEGPSPVQGEEDLTRPLSRVPPMRAGGELTWREAGTGTYIGGAVFWSADQDRLSFGDTQDSRIPFGGTPGFTVAELRLGLRWNERVTLRAVLENILNDPWRVHGSGVLGAGSGATITLETTL